MSKNTGDGNLGRIGDDLQELFVTCGKMSNLVMFDMLPTCPGMLSPDTLGIVWYIVKFLIHYTCYRDFVMCAFSFIVIFADIWEYLNTLKPMLFNEAMVYINF